jgi:hypothetical protein
MRSFGYENAPHAQYLTDRERLNRDRIAFIGEHSTGVVDTAAAAPLTV